MSTCTDPPMMYEVGIAISLRRADRDYAAEQTATHVEIAHSLEEALRVYSRYYSSLERVRRQLDLEREPRLQERQIEGA